jgi:hypothetical protein
LERFRKEMTMRNFLMIACLALLGLAACGGHDEKTTVVTPPPVQVAPGSTVVVPPGTTTKVCPPGYATC